MGEINKPARILKLTTDHIDRFWSLVIKDKECWLWTGHKNSAGYGLFGVFKKQYLAHRVSLSLSGRTSDKQVRHLCNTPACVNPDHLVFGTYHEQYEDQVTAGTNVCGRQGDRNWWSKLSAEDVKEIRESSDTQVSLATKFGVSKVSIHKIKQRKTWKDANKYG